MTPSARALLEIKRLRRELCVPPEYPITQAMVRDFVRMADNAARRPKDWFATIDITTQMWEPR